MANDGGTDLAVPGAGELRDFYNDGTGRTPTPVSVGDYENYCMNALDRREARGGKIPCTPGDAGEAAVSA